MEEFQYSAARRKVDERRGVVFRERPEAKAFRRWQVGEFLEVERRFAKAWRDELTALDLRTVAAGMNAMGINPQTCKSLEQVRTLADEFLHSVDRPLDRLKLAVLTLGLPPESEPFIAEQWKRSGFRPLPEHALFAAHLFKVELFFQIALAANLISTNRASNWQDVAYLSYLRLCMIFVSSDKLHRRSAPYLLRPDQSFVWGADLKADLQRLAQRYQASPQQEQEMGLLKFARTPPQDADCLVARLWDHHFGILRQEEADRLKRLFDEPVPNQEHTVDQVPRQSKSLPTGEKELVEHLNRFRDATELSPEEIDFDTANPDLLSIQRRVHKRKGSFWQLPKDLKDALK